MTRLLYEIEDYLDDTSQVPELPEWARGLIRALGRAIGKAGDALRR